ncbi:hypothetical protein FRC11_000828, partial [Ceratobasidium sp. 423]
MSHQPPASKEKRKKQLDLGTSDPDSIPSTHNTSTIPNPKRARLDAAPPSASMTISGASVSTQADGHPRDSATTTGNRARKGKIGSKIKSLLGTLELSAEVFGPLKSAISGLNRCVDIYERSSTGRNGYEELREKLEGLLDDLTEHMAIPMGLVMTNSVKRLCAGIEAEIKNVEEKHARNTGRRLVDAMGESDEILECYRRIHGHLERITLNANMSILNAVNEQITETRLAKMCSAMSAVYNSAESDDVRRGGCAPGTRELQIDFLLEWARNPGAGKTCWMNGMAGTGKTTIAYSVCGKLDETYELGASFFCSRIIPECRQVKHIIPSIAYQLARFSFPFRCALDKILESDPDAHTRALKVQYRELIVEPLLQVQGSLPTEFVVVIDALDECENQNSLSQVLDLLLSPVFALPLRFLVSSRPEPEISRRMTRRVEGQDGANLVLHNLDADAVKSDIERYMKHELEHIPLTDAQWSGLLDRCGVLFIYASTTCLYIEQAYNMETLDEAVSAIVNSTSIPPEHGDQNGIDKLYLMILIAAFNKPGMSQPNKTRMKHVLEVVICAMEPMTLHTIACLLGLGSAEQVKALLQPLRSVVNVTEVTGLVTTLHASFPDFMFSPNRARTFHCIEERRHSALAEACLRLIDAAEPKFNICGLPSSYLFDDEVENLDKQISQAISSGLVYACQFWAGHLCLGEFQDQLLDMVRHFFSERLLLWMEILNLKQGLHFGTIIIQDAKEWCDKHVVPGDVAMIAHDAWQFVSIYANHPISGSTPHIYVSMLPFWPRSRPVSKAYMPRTTGLIEPTGSAIAQQQLALLATWTVSNESVYSISLSADGTRMAAAHQGITEVLDRSTGESLLSLTEDGTRGVKAVAISPDGTRLASSGNNNVLRLWDISDEERATELLLVDIPGINHIVFSPNGNCVAFGSEDGCAYLCVLHEGEIIPVPLKGHTAAVTSVAFSPDGLYLASGSRDSTVRLWDLQTNQMVATPFGGYTDGDCPVTYSPDGSRLASASSDGSIWVWDPHSRLTLLGPLNEHSAGVCSIAFSPNGHFIASGSYDKTIRVYDAQTGQTALGPLAGHNALVSSIIFPPDDTCLVSSSWDGTICIWNLLDLNTPKEPLPAPVLSHPITTIRYSHSGLRVASGSSDGTIHVWDVRMGKMVLGPLRGHADCIYSVDFSPNDAYIASASEDSTLRIWDAWGGTDIHGPLLGHSSAVTCVRFSPDSSFIVSGSRDSLVQIWEVTSGQLVIKLLEGNDDPIRSVGFSPDGRHVVSGSLSGTIQVLDRQIGGAVLGPLQGHDYPITEVKYSPDGLRILSCSYGGLVYTWDAQTGQEILTCGEHNLEQRYGEQLVAFSPGGHYVVSTSDDWTIRVWDVQTGDLVLDSLEGHTDAIQGIQFSPDGSQVVSCSEDRTIRFWDVSSCRTNPRDNECK